MLWRKGDEGTFSYFQFQQCRRQTGFPEDREYEPLKLKWLLELSTRKIYGNRAGRNAVASIHSRPCRQASRNTH